MPDVLCTGHGTLRTQYKWCIIYSVVCLIPAVIFGLAYLTLEIKSINYGAQECTPSMDIGVVSKSRRSDPTISKKRSSIPDTMTS